MALSNNDYAEVMAALSETRQAVEQLEASMAAYLNALTAALTSGEERRNNLAQRHELRLKGLEDRLALHLELHAHQLAERERGA